MPPLINLGGANRARLLHEMPRALPLSEALRAGRGALVESAGSDEYNSRGWREPPPEWWHAVAVVFRRNVIGEGLRRSGKSVTARRRELQARRRESASLLEFVGADNALGEASGWVPDMLAQRTGGGVDFRGLAAGLRSLVAMIDTEIAALEAMSATRASGPRDELGRIVAGALLDAVTVANQHAARCGEDAPSDPSSENWFPALLRAACQCLDLPPIGRDKLQSVLSTRYS
jgi:hypothetical protein